MQKIYGYKEEDVVKLATFVYNNKDKSRSEIFKEFATLNKKAQGTVRNMYYALVKRSALDKEFCAKYLGGKPLDVGKIVKFNKQEEEELIRRILVLKKQGKSVRSAINELALGDIKLALRYQNKYRNAVKNNPALIEKLWIEIGGEPQKMARKCVISEVQYLRLKKEIDGLIERISASVLRENSMLKQRVEQLENENARLTTKNDKENEIKNALLFFKKQKGKNVIN